MVATNAEQPSTMLDLGSTLSEETIRSLQSRLLNLRAHGVEQSLAVNEAVLANPNQPRVILLPAKTGEPNAALFLVPVAQPGSNDVKLALLYCRDSAGLGLKPVVQATTIDLPIEEAPTHTVVIGQQPDYLEDPARGVGHRDKIVGQNTPHYVAVNAGLEEGPLAQIAVNFTGEGGIKATNIGYDNAPQVETVHVRKLYRWAAPVFQQHFGLTLPFLPSTN